MGSAGGTNCYLKSMCDEDNLSHNNPGVYIYFKGLMKEGKVFFISYGYIIGSPSYCVHFSRKTQVGNVTII